MSERPKDQRDTGTLIVSIISLALAITSLYFQFFHKRAGVTATLLECDVTRTATRGSAGNTPPPRASEDFRVELIFAIANTGDHDAIVVEAIALRDLHEARNTSFPIKGVSISDPKTEVPAVLKPGEITLRRIVGHIALEPHEFRSTPERQMPQQSIEISVMFRTIAADGKSYFVTADLGNIRFELSGGWQMDMRATRIDLLAEEGLSSIQGGGAP